LQLGRGGALGCFKLKTAWYVALAAASKAGGGNSSSNSTGSGAGGGAGGGGGGAQQLVLQRHVRELLDLLGRRPTLRGVPAHLVWAGALLGATGEADDTMAACRNLLARRHQADGSSSGENGEGGQQCALVGVCASSDLDRFQAFEEAVAAGSAALADAFCAWGARVHATAGDVGATEDPASSEALQGGKKAVVGAAAALAVGCGWGAKLVASSLKAPPNNRFEVAAEVGVALGALVKGHRWGALASVIGVEWDEAGAEGRLLAVTMGTDEGIVPMSVGASERSQERSQAPDAGRLQGSEGEASAGDPAEEPAKRHQEPFAAAAVSRVKPPAGELLEVTSVGGFATPPSGLREHVIGPYLSKKVSNYLGLPSTLELSGDARVTIPSNHGPAEGKLKGQWERFVAAGVLDLRVDLQPRRTAEGAQEDGHYGSSRFANLAVQFGANRSCKRSSRASRATGGEKGKGAFAGVFLECDVGHRFEDVRRAMDLSFERKAYVRLWAHGGSCSGGGGGDHQGSATTAAAAAATGGVQQQKTWKVFVDLDDTLADFSGKFQALFGGQKPEDVDKKVLWQRVEAVKSGGGFFASLGWAPGGAALWAYLQDASARGLCEPPAVLTGLPNSKLGKHARRQKEAWVASHLGHEVVCHACASSEKSKWASPGAVLVDDQAEQHRAPWEACGGTFVHCAPSLPAQALWRLKALLEPATIYAGPRAEAQRLMEATRAAPLCPATEFPFIWVGQRRPAAPANSTSGGADSADSASSADGADGADGEAGDDAEATDEAADAEAQFARAVEDASVVALDAEWRPDELLRRGPHQGKKSAACLLQVCKACASGWGWEVAMVGLGRRETPTKTSICYGVD